MTRKFAIYRGHKVEIISDPHEVEILGERVMCVSIKDTDISALAPLSELSEFEELPTND